MLDQLLESEAKVRLQRLAIVKPEKARKVEDSIIGAAVSGNLRGKVTEPQLIELLENISAGNELTKTAKVVIQRRKYFEDEEEDDTDLL